MKNWIPNSRITTLVLATTIFCALLYFGGLFMVTREISKIEDFYNDTESESAKSERAEAMKSAIDLNRFDIDALRGFFVQKGDDVKFIETIEAAAKDSDIIFDLSSIDVKQGKDDPIKENVVVKMNIEGDWQDLMRFIDKLEKMAFGVSIQNLSLDTHSQDKWSGSVDFIIFREK